MIRLAVAPYPILARTVSIVETLGEAQNVIAKTHDICHRTIIQLADSADAVRRSLNDQLQVLEDRDFEVILEHYHEFTRELADSASLSSLSDAENPPPPLNTNALYNARNPSPPPANILSQVGRRQTPFIPPRFTPPIPVPPPQTNVKGRCWICTKTDHFKMDCPLYKCEHCGVSAPGHYENHCPLRCERCGQRVRTHKLIFCHAFSCSVCSRTAPGHSVKNCPDIPGNHLRETTPDEDFFEFDDSAMANMTEEPYGNNY